MGRKWQRLMLLTPAPPPPSPCQIEKPATVARRRSDCYVQRQAAESNQRSLYKARLSDNEEWQTLLTPASPPFRSCRIKKDPTTVARRHSDCLVRQQAAKSGKSLQKLSKSMLRYNEEWPPLPAPSSCRPAHQGEKPVQLERRRWVTFQIDDQKAFQESIKQLQQDVAKKERKRVRRRQRERNRKRRRHKERKEVRKYWREHNERMEKRAAELNKFFQQVISGRKSEHEELEEQI